MSAGENMQRDYTLQIRQGNHSFSYGLSIHPLFLSIYLPIYHFSIYHNFLQKLVAAVWRPPIRMQVYHPPQPFMAVIKCLWTAQQLIFQGLFLLSEGSEKNLSAGEIKPFFFRGEKWTSRLSTLKCYSGFPMNEKWVCIVMRLERGLRGL